MEFNERIRYMATLPFFFFTGREGAGAVFSDFSHHRLLVDVFSFSVVFGLFIVVPLSYQKPLVTIYCD